MLHFTCARWSPRSLPHSKILIRALAWCLSYNDLRKKALKRLRRFENRFAERSCHQTFSVTFNKTNKRTTQTIPSTQANSLKNSIFLFFYFVAPLQPCQCWNSNGLLIYIFTVNLLCQANSQRAADQVFRKIRHCTSTVRGRMVVTIFYVLLTADIHVCLSAKAGKFSVAVIKCDPASHQHFHYFFV